MISFFSFIQFKSHGAHFSRVSFRYVERDCVMAGRNIRKSEPASRCEEPMMKCIRAALVAEIRGSIGLC
jgi:hypothetical protein